MEINWKSHGLTLHFIIAGFQLFLYNIITHTMFCIKNINVLSKNAQNRSLTLYRCRRRHRHLRLHPCCFCFLCARVVGINQPDIPKTTIK